MRFLQAQTRYEFQPHPEPALPPTPLSLDSPRGLDRGSSAGGSGGAGPKNGVRLMVPMVSPGESSSWQESQGTEPHCQQGSMTWPHSQLHLYRGPASPLHTWSSKAGRMVRLLGGGTNQRDMGCEI